MRNMQDMDECIKCTVPGCSCLGFQPGKVKFRSCDRCGHGWVVHALQQLQAQTSSSCSPAEVVLPGPVLDLSSLVLYGAQAVPVHLKILLDRLYSVLTAEQVGHILNTLGWSLGDYVRGYMLQSPGGKVLDCWTMVTPEEELLIIKQFLRFGETRSIVDLMTHRFLSVNQKTCCSNTSLTSLNLRSPGTFQNSREHLGADVCRLENKTVLDRNKTVGHFENLPGGLSLLLPFHFPGSTFGHLVPSNKVPPLKLTLYLQDPDGTHLSQGLQQNRESSNDKPSVKLLQPKSEPVIKIEAEVEKPNTRLLVPQNFHGSDNLDHHMGGAKQRSASPFSSSFSPTSFSAPHLSAFSSSVSPLKNVQKLHFSATSSFCSAPSISAPCSSLGTLQPLPPSCSLPSSSVGGRKGRVCCGVCGKSFYDKGTLKIHYNAVHLKIKHRCTVAGCTMVFSSLRSRNRHSANPNPRLHGSGSNKDAGTHGNLECDPRTPGATPPATPRDKHLTWNNSFNLQLPPLPPQSSVTPCVVEESQHLVNISINDPTPETPPGLTAFNIKAKGNSHTGAHQHHQWESCDAIPKKKPRKSSKPVKIEKEEVKGRSIKKEQEF